MVIPAGTSPPGRAAPPRRPVRRARRCAAAVSIAAAAASSAAMRLGVTVQLSRLPFSIEFMPMRQMLNSQVSR